MNSLTSSLDNGYTFPFCSTNPSFTSIAWSYTFLISILSNCFFPNTFIHGWNFFSTNFLVSTSDPTISSSSSQISHSSAILFTSAIFPFFCFFLLSLSLLPPFVSSNLTFLTLVSTVFYTPLGISSFLLPLFSNLFLGCGVLTMASPKLLSTSVPLLH